MVRRVLISSILACSLSLSAIADFSDHYNAGQNYLTNYQYSSAILEFQNALKINYLDNSARIGLVNSYLANGSFLATKNKDYEGAANAYRSALFYLLYYPNTNTSNNSGNAISSVKKNLETCLDAVKFDKSPDNRFLTAKQLRAEGNFPAAGYEFMQAIGNRQYVKDSFEQVGDMMKMLRNYPKAVEYYRKAVALAPDDTNLRMTYAKMLDIIGNEDEAVKEFNQVLSQTSSNTNPEVLYSLERIYKKKLDKTPSDSNVTTNLGAILQKQGKFDEALAYYAKAEQLDKNNVNARLNVGTLYQQKKDYIKALEAYNSVLLLYPKNVQANLYKAETYEELGRNKDAKTIYEKVLALEPTNEEAGYRLKNLLRSTLSTSEFVDYVKKYSRTGKPADELYLYALDLHKENRLDDAISIYKEVLAMSSDNAEVYVNLALAQSQKKDYESALALLKVAQDKFPKNEQVKDTIDAINAEINDSKLAKASEYYNNGDFTEALKIYEAIKHPTEEIMLTIATCYQNMDNMQSALEAYKKAFEINPRNAETAYYIASVFTDSLNDKNSGIMFANKALQIDPEHEGAKQLLKYINEQNEMQDLDIALNLFEENKYDESFNMLNKILGKNPQNAYALYYRGMIFDARENFKSAVTDYEQALKFTADIPIINYLLGIDYDTLNDNKNALKSYEKFLASYNVDDEFKSYASERVKELKN